MIRLIRCDCPYIAKKIGSAPTNMMMVICSTMEEQTVIVDRV